MTNPADQNIHPPFPQQPLRQRALYSALRTPNAWPKWLSKYSIAVYLLALGAVTLMYSSHSLPWYYMLSGVVAVLAFFLYGSKAVKDLAPNRIKKEKNFEKKIFTIALVPRLVTMLLLYGLFQVNYGDAFGFENGDAFFYDDIGRNFAASFRDGNVIATWNAMTSYLDVSDMGYGIYMGFVYWLTGNGIIIMRLIKCMWSALTVVLIYRLAKRNFGEQTGRMAAIFCALWPNFWYYSSVHLKETEMLFLGVLFVEQSDQMLRSRQFTAWKVIPILLIAAAIFTFRTSLGLVALLALVFSVVMSSSKVVNWGKRIIVGILAVLLIGVTMGNRIEEQARQMLQTVQTDDQHRNMEWRSVREHGNKFAKYAGASVFAPMIFTLPFPTLAQAYEGQNMQMILNGGNFVKNIISGFTLMAMVVLLMSGKWREHLLPLSFMLGYLVVLVFSSFAQAERFHQPAMPFELMFAAYGLSIAITKPKYKRWFSYWCGVMFVAAMAWNWFKLAGRGML